MLNVIYLHGFASSPGAAKARAFEEHLSQLGVRVVRADLRVPTRDHLRLSAMVARTKELVREHAPIALVGSSLGGLVVVIVITQEPSLRGAVLLAPAFGFAERWPMLVGPEVFERWRAGEPFITPDHAGGPALRIDFGFYEDALAQEAAWLAQLGQPCSSCEARQARSAAWLIFHGRQDAVVDLGRSRAFAAGLPHAELMELDDGHELIQSLPVMLPRVAAFLAGLGAHPGDGGAGP